MFIWLLSNFKSVIIVVSLQSQVFTHPFKFKVAMCIDAMLAMQNLHENMDHSINREKVVSILLLAHRTE